MGPQTKKMKQPSLRRTQSEIKKNTKAHVASPKGKIANDIKSKLDKLLGLSDDDNDFKTKMKSKIVDNKRSISSSEDSSPHKKLSNMSSLIPQTKKIKQPSRRSSLTPQTKKMKQPSRRSSLTPQTKK